VDAESWDERGDSIILLDEPPPPPEEPPRPPPPSPGGGWTSSRFGLLVFCIGLGVAIERVSLFAFLPASQATPSVMVAAALAFLSVPLVAFVVLGRAFAQAREADRRRR
jgi:hypothetical protein